MANYVLVHGGAHGGWCWSEVARRLRREGHDVYAPTLTGLGERSHLLSPAIDLDLHIADVVNVVEFEDLNDVILVGHSYGGMVITGVADRVPDRIVEIVFLDAAIPEDGEALIDWSPALKDLALAEARVVDGVELVLWPDSPSFHVYGIDDEALARQVRAKLTPHPWKCFIQPLQLGDGGRVKALSRTVINCSATLKVRSPSNLQRCLRADRVWEIDAGHDVMLTEPGALTTFLLRLSEER